MAATGRPPIVDGTDRVVELAGIPERHEEIYRIIREKQELFTPGGKTELGRKLQKSFGRVMLLSDSAHAFGMSKKVKNSDGSTSIKMVFLAIR